MFALEQSQHLCGLELTDENRCPAEDDLRQGVHEKSARVEHREDVEVDIVMCHIVDDGVERIPRDHAVGHFRGFRKAGRSAGEYQGGDVLCFEAGTGNGGVGSGLEGGFKVKRRGKSIAVNM